MVVNECCNAATLQDTLRTSLMSFKGLYPMYACLASFLSSQCHLYKAFNECQNVSLLQWQSHTYLSFKALTSYCAESLSASKANRVVSNCKYTPT